jgi:hypothetical protein
MRNRFFIATLAIGFFMFTGVMVSAQSTSNSCPTFTRSLAHGSRGADVTSLQQFLIAQNLLASGNATGYFGAFTQAAVQNFQCGQGLVCSGNEATTGYGLVGTHTRAAVVRACGSQSTATNSSSPSTAPASSTAPSSGSTSAAALLNNGGSLLKPKSCIFNNQTIPSGASVTAYQAQTVPFGQTCLSESRLCSNGTLSGSYQYVSCKVAQPVVPPLDRIGVTQTSSGPGFHDTVTGATFIPRGNNYIVSYLETQHLGVLWHGTFDTDKYNPTAAETALQRMAADGYNVVRVFLNPLGMAGKLIGPGIDPAYLANVVDFLHRAEKNKVYVVLTGTAGILPPNYYNDTRTNQNAYILNQQFVDIESAEWKNVVSGIKAADALLLSTIFGYDAMNEVELYDNQAPFSQASGTVQLIDGNSYDMSSALSRQQAADDSDIYWANQMTRAIKGLDPQALVTASVYTPYATGRSGFDGLQNNASDHRMPARPTALQRSNLDYLDAHFYVTNATYNLAADMHSAEFDTLPVQKPRVMGEFGVFKSVAADAATALAKLNSLQSNSCLNSFNGWLLWTWNDPHMIFVWNALDDGAIEKGLSPAFGVRTVCNGVTQTPPTNLALGKSVSVSATYAGYPGSNAVDGSAATWWSTGGFAPQWIQVDLGAPHTIAEIRLNTAQSPSGPTTHNIYGSASGAAGSWQLLNTFQESTTDSQVLDYMPSQPLTSIRYIKVETTASPSWVGWREIQVMGN